MNTENAFDYDALWQTATQGAGARHGVPSAGDDGGRHQEALTDAFAYFLLRCYAESLRMSLASRWLPLEGLDSARWQAMRKLNMHPHQARSLVEQDLLWALHDELRQFSLPPEARNACRPALNEAGLGQLLDADS
ncbi:hypothetical protein [Salinicola rhizosphaerae]|uniref:Uncharacterized protein n=1 Tax=Salinicola rhizosphaerae TaxID=1443141 RepID=A0ABQ3E0Y6_9GAMM|nr:hypothetical protein [Salinicola rhizosphaerae]GHB22779.1 hypothetical protein GCM10009038_22230 [Salinicola rhizosphaerae]